ncbi:MAG: hypothetical protein GDA44_15485, partial [Prochloron sp. SP5CPC1]|nr:hypothetical protein [Candidatus Paraprochloron terpiosi SP5CPC1]
HREIEAELRLRGEPLRWAITSIDKDKQKAYVEAIVTSDQLKIKEKK